ncbi:hypothetical protein BGW80DRAFT_588107 [Lactifluus volemus]|nr:hypothetical protein BGW80DRAFT_588107 [Lactifluus volemus]
MIAATVCLLVCLPLTESCNPVTFHFSVVVWRSPPASARPAHPSHRTLTFDAYMSGSNTRIRIHRLHVHQRCDCGSQKHGCDRCGSHDAMRQGGVVDKDSDVG